MSTSPPDEDWAEKDARRRERIATAVLVSTQWDDIENREIEVQCNVVERRVRLAVHVADALIEEIEKDY